MVRFSNHAPRRESTATFAVLPVRWSTLRVACARSPGPCRAGALRLSGHAPQETHVHPNERGARAALRVAHPPHELGALPVLFRWG